MVALSDLRTSIRQRADIVNSQYVTDAELNSYVNESIGELYDLVLAAYETYWVKGPYTFAITNPQDDNDGYTLPADCYKFFALDRQDVSSPSGFWVTVPRFEFLERNGQTGYPYSSSGSVMGRYDVKYNIIGNELYVAPYNLSTGTYRFWYTPYPTVLAADGDALPATMSGPAWHAYIITDCAIKIYQKQEDDPSTLIAQKEALRQRVIQMAATRDEGQTYRVGDTHRRFSPWGGWGSGWGW